MMNADKQIFTETFHCSCGAHCGICRDKEGGRKWREHIARTFAVPEIDFVCPPNRGAKPWLIKYITGLGDLIASVANPIAGAIDSVLGTKLKGCGGCKGRQAKLNAAFPIGVDTAPITERPTQ